jgi:N utilization substance protein A
MQVYVRRLFAPAEVRKVLEVGSDRYVVVVANEDLSLAIGRQGQNVKLATKLLGKELDVFGEDEFAELPDAERRAILGEPELVEEAPAEVAAEAPAVEPVEPTVEEPATAQ